MTEPQGQQWQQPQQLVQHRGPQLFYLVDDKTQRAIQFFCHAAGIAIWLYLVGILIIVVFGATAIGKAVGE